MWGELSKKAVFRILTLLAASCVSKAGLAQTNVLLIGPEEIAVQVRQQWKESEATCARLAQTNIDHVDVIDNKEFKSWLILQQLVPDDGVQVLPEGHYARVASSAERPGDGITVYGPIHKALQSTDFGKIIGLPICNHKLFQR